MKLIKVLAIYLLFSSGAALADTISVNENNGFTFVQGNLDTNNTSDAGWFHVAAHGNTIMLSSFIEESRSFKACRVDDTDPAWSAAQQLLIASTSDVIQFSFAFKNDEVRCLAVSGSSTSS